MIRAPKLKTSLLTLFEKTLHLLTRLIIVDEDVKAQALEALKQLTCISVRAISYIHPCGDNLLWIHTICNNTECLHCIRRNMVCTKHVSCTCLFIKIFVIDDDALSHSLVAHLILECWWNNSVMAFRRVVLLPRLAILILLTNSRRETEKLRKINTAW